MLEKTRGRMRERMQAARLRETKFLMSFDLAMVNRRLVILLSVMVTLCFLDVLTTLVALKLGPPFVELNPIASNLFRLDFPGFVTALTLKYIPILPLAYATALRTDGRRVVVLRVVKVSALIALVAADIIYLAVVGSNSFTLLRYYYG
jgi:hypothetical protein